MVKNPQTLTMSNSKLKTKDDRELQLEMIENWLNKHKLTLTAITTTIEATAMAAFLGTFHFINAHFWSAISYDPPKIVSVAIGGPFEQGRNLAIIGGVHTTLCSVIRTVRGKEKEDVKEGLVAGFGAEYVGAMASGMKGIHAISNAIVFSLVYGLVTKVKMNYLRKREEDLMYYNTRGMLSTLGLEQFEKNFKRGMLADRTLPLLTNSDLQEVEIPAGARRVILKHIQKTEFIRKVADAGKKF